MSAHTPGPWSTPSTFTRIEGPQFQIIARLRKAEHSPMRDMRAVAAEEEANARLIAAAPDLLAALMAINDLLNTRSGYTTAGIVKAAKISRASLAKVRA